MSSRTRRVLFGLVVIAMGSAVIGALLFFVARPFYPYWLAVLCEIAVVAVGVGIAVTPGPEPDAQPVTVLASAPSSAYRGPATPPPIITKASAKRFTIAFLAALAFTAAAVPFAVHLPRWIEMELVIGAWWLLWSAVLAVVAYRGAHVDDDHRPDGKPIVDLSGGSGVTMKWTDIFQGATDLEGCVVALIVLVVVGVALLGAWLVVELVAPAIFVVAYRGIIRALARARAANTRGNAARSALVGMGWAVVHTAPLAALVAVVHALFFRA